MENGKYGETSQKWKISECFRLPSIIAELMADGKHYLLNCTIFLSRSINDCHNFKAATNIIIIIFIISLPSSFVCFFLFMSIDNFQFKLKRNLTWWRSHAVVRTQVRAQFSTVMIRWHKEVTLVFVRWITCCWLSCRR